MFKEVGSSLPKEVTDQFYLDFPGFERNRSLRVYWSRGQWYKVFCDTDSTYYYLRTSLNRPVRQTQIEFSDSDVPEYILGYCNSLDLEDQKKELDNLRNLKYAEMDETSFNRKDLAR